MNVPRRSAQSVQVRALPAELTRSGGALGAVQLVPPLYYTVVCCSMLHYVMFYYIMFDYMIVYCIIL